MASLLCNICIPLSHQPPYQKPQRSNLPRLISLHTRGFHSQLSSHTHHPPPQPSTSSPPPKHQPNIDHPQPQQQQPTRPKPPSTNTSLGDRQYIILPPLSPISQPSHVMTSRSTNPPTNE